ncbi:hypothetical protein Tco_1346951 [Tanacetum coccineum]
MSVLMILKRMDLKWRWPCFHGGEKFIKVCWGRNLTFHYGQRKLLPLIRQRLNVTTATGEKECTSGISSTSKALVVQDGIWRLLSGALQDEGYKWD